MIFCAKKQRGELPRCYKLFEFERFGEAHQLANGIEDAVEGVMVKPICPGQSMALLYGVVHQQRGIAENVRFGYGDVFRIKAVFAREQRLCEDKFQISALIKIVHYGGGSATYDRFAVPLVG